MAQPWTVSRGPIVAGDIDIQKSVAINSLLVRPIGILPAEPGDPIRPFAVGLFDEIRLLLKPDAGTTKLRRAIAAFVHSKRYYYASAQPDSMRFDIDGKPIEPLSAEDGMTAQTRLLLLREKDKIVQSPSPLPAPTVP